ncbi:Glyoxalase-like-dom domain-containing protein [Fusarium keratoplasticum]|uniref:Glyoxalase-like-dom domain-containing protein n=1 Tax=Fusarium keratoplasticum TaxID=1328300 RepID=A0ACC0R3P0_9HYPO|nr:Glyoxalase-like-dom domain-containing protein [Fusarium keratoplasticum]KAI8671792.1 Glyoxalase-like-dom domain-containing protein [Fusarium keratoplasticum]KAI8679010.1 Glyoxalase-like-dom domain-containing protein [Fusarium keratoplasticum]
MALPILDHIAILVSFQTLQTVTDQLKDSLIVIDGGAHADGLTVNKLIHLADGTYIEFIAFVEGVDPEKRRAHRWGNLEEGKIADWAHTLHSEADYVQLQKRVADAAAGVTYSDLVPLQRHRPDGVLMKCLVSVALDSEGKRVFPATVPFWCVDVTERHLRSPFKGEDGPHEYTKHPSHAKGLSRITVLLPEKEISTYKPVYDAIHNSVAASEAGVFSWPYELPAGLNPGSNQVALSSLSNGGNKAEVRLTLLGTKESPKSIELLPGLVLDFEAAA